MTRHLYKAARTVVPLHPGEVLGDMIPDMGLPKVAIAARLGISRNHLYAILNGRHAITPDLAARLGKFFGNGPGLWLRMQANYDTWHAEHDIDVSGIQTFDAA